MHRGGWICPHRSPRSAPRGHGKTRYRAVRSGRCHGSKDAPACEAQFLTETQFLEGPGNIGTLVLARLETAGLYKIIGVLVPAAVRKVVSKHGGGGLRLADDTDRHIG